MGPSGLIDFTVQMGTRHLKLAVSRTDTQASRSAVLAHLRALRLEKHPLLAKRTIWLPKSADSYRHRTSQASNRKHQPARVRILRS